MSWAAAAKRIYNLGLDPTLFPNQGDKGDVWSVAVPVGKTFNGWLQIMNEELQPERWMVQSLSVLLDGQGVLVVVAICRRAAQLGGGILVPQPAAPPDLRPVQ